MPTPPRTDRAAIVAAARDLAETAGLDGVTMQAVADRVGVRAPSLYKHVRDRRELLELMLAAGVEELTARMASTVDEPDPRRRIVRQAAELRAFAHEHPVGYSMVFGAHLGPTPDAAATVATVQPLLDATAELVGPEHALDAARLLTAWANGFITMELGSAFRLGSDVDAAWEWGLARITAAIA